MGQTSFINRARLNLAKAIAPRTATPSRRELWPYGDGAYSGYRLQWARRMPELRLDPYGVALAAETSVWAKACIDLRAAAVSRMPWTITDAAGNELENTPFHNMMRYARLSYQQNLFALWETSLSVHGETYLEKLNNSDVPGFMIPGGLRILNAIAMTPQIVAGEVTHYQYIANGGKTRLEVSDVFVHRYNSLTDDFRASAPMITAMDAIGIKRSMQSFMRGHYDNDATPGGIVSPKAGVTANETWVNRIMSMWADTFKGSNNANSVGFIPAEIDFKQFDRKMPEHQQALSDDQIGEICAAFRVPVEMVRSAAAKDPLGGGGKMDSARAMFYEDFVEPECENIDAFINDVILPWLMPNSGAVFAFDYDETRSLISDTKERSDKIINEFNNGVITFNQMQIALDYEPIPGGDWYQFTPGKVIVMANQIANAPALMAAAAPKLPEPPAPAALPAPAENKDLLQLSAPAQPDAKSAAVMLHMGNHPDLIALQNKTRAYVGDTPVKWNNPSEFHVTLASMPVVTDEQAKALQTALEDVDIPDMSLKVGSLNTFDNLDSHAVHFRVRKSVDLLDLQETIHDLINSLGIPMSSFSAPEAYKPHVTMGYADSKPPARTFDSKVTVKPTALHLGVGDEVVYKKPIGDVITPEPTPPEDKPKAKYDDNQRRADDGKWTDGGGSSGSGSSNDNKPESDNSSNNNHSEGNNQRSSGGKVEKHNQTLSRGIESTTYSLSEVPGSELQIVKRVDGYRSIATFNLPPNETGKGYGQRLLLSALDDGPVLHKSESDIGDNFTRSAYQVRESLIKKGKARVVTDEYGTKLLEKTPDNSKAFDYAKATLDELAQWEKKVKNKGVKAVFVNYLIRDEIADTLRSALATDGAEVKAAFAVAREQIAKKAVASTRLDFENQFDDLLNAARNDEATRQQFRSKLAFLLNKYGKLAYMDGLTDGGLDDPELSPDDSDTIASMLASQSQYVSGISNVLFKGDGVTDSQADMKASLWWNKSLQPFYDAGLLSADKDSLYEWVYGDVQTEHCPDCETLNGQRHRLKQYGAKGLMPKADKLSCGGWQCKCTLVKVSGKARGNWLGASKSEHTHTHELAKVVV